ncbi:MAG: MBL fold metallo-hydrolase [Acidimicrobiia bacterium]|nr:MBL fold metallo-hydrolase [Acidimicrobiia bacterium]
MDRPRKQEQEEATEDVTEVAPGVLRTQLPISMPGLGHVNCYVLEDERGIAVVDPGLPGAESWGHLVDRLERAGYRVSDVHTVVVTHSHPDHFGGAYRLRHETGADVVTHKSFLTLFDGSGEATVDEDGRPSEDSADLVFNSAEERIDAIERYLGRPTPWGGQRTGPPREFLERLWADDPTSSGLAGPLKPTQPLIDGQTIRLARREWLAMHTPGHTHDHLCLYDPEHGVVLTGDHVLPTITPHISGLTLHTDPLALFFASLHRMAGINDVAIALPAHGHPFTDLSGRSEHIIDHHEDRLEIIRQAGRDLHEGAVGEGTVNDYMKVLFRERSWGDMAESETYAHLEHLRTIGDFVRTSVDGLARYAPA